MHRIDVSHNGHVTIEVDPGSGDGVLKVNGQEITHFTKVGLRDLGALILAAAGGPPPRLNDCRIGYSW